MTDRLGLSTRMTMVLSPPFFVIAYVLFSGAKGSDVAVVIAAAASFLVSIALAGWLIRLVVSERREAKRTAQSLRSAEDNLRLAERKGRTDRELQQGFEQMEEALIGGLDIDALAEAVITALCRYVGAPVGALYLKRTGDAEAQPVYERVAGVALHDLDEGRTYQHGEGIVGQVAKTGRAMEVASPPEAPLVVDDGLRRRRQPNVLSVYPIVANKDVLGVICLGLQEGLKGGKRRFSERILRSVAIAFQAAIARRAAAATLKDFQDLAERLQHQQEVLRVTNTRLEEQAVALEQAREEAEVRNTDLRKAEAEAALRADEASRANTYKSEFLANMSHELRTPLNSIILLSKLLAEGRSGALTGEQAKQAGVIHQAGSDLLGLINDVLDLSKIEAGKMRLLVEEVKLERLVLDAHALFAPLAERKAVTLNSAIDDDLPAQMITDGDRIKQILRNFLSNAIKFVDSGQITVFAQALRPEHLEALHSGQARREQLRAEPGGYVALGVTDTGIGIPADRQKIIFEAFRQADGTTSRKYGGTGLGLNIVTKLADLLEGAVGMWSQEGEGSTFFVVVPLRSAVNEAAVSPDEVSLVTSEKTQSGHSKAPERLADSEPIGRGRRVLLVDDDVRNTYALTIALELDGFEVVTAANGRQALEQLDQKAAFDLVLMDIMMPEMDGYEAIRRLRADERFVDLPVLALTARTQPEDRAACMEAGADDYLVKPIDHNLLIERLDRALNREELTS